MADDLSWSPTLSVGVATLDRQHQVLLRLTREMVRAAEGGREPEVVEALFAGLLAFTREHFHDEERLLEAAAFPGLEAHRAVHQELLAKAGDFHARFRQGTVDAAGFGLFFVGWVLLHIRHEDQAYTSHLRAAGIA
jgi:hemerythrin-like metal-binding protein